MNFIFIDESAIRTKNNNFKNLKLNTEEIYCKIKDSEKRNLILSVNPERNIYYKITKNNTNFKEFKIFFEELLDKLDENEKIKSLFILDNFKAHSTPEMFTFYNNNNLKILFGAPYLSKFNMIEYCFRGIKNILYKNIFSSIKEVIKKTDDILKNKDFILLINFILKRL